MGWLCSYSPIEIMYAAGFQPYRIDGHSEPIASADSYISSNYCQFVRSTVDIAAAGGYDFLEGVVFVNSCDAMRRLYDVWIEHFPSKFNFMLDIPMGSSTLGVKYLRNEFEKLKIALEEFTSNPIEDKTVEDSIDLFSESRSLYNDLNALRLKNPPEASGTDIFKFGSEFFKSDPQEWNTKIKALLGKEKLDLQNKPTPNKPRVLLSGSPLHDFESIKFIEECGLNVSYEDICSGSKFFDLKIKKTGDALATLSEAYLKRTPCARMMKIDERAKLLIDITNQYSLDGIVHHSLKFCDTYLYDVPKLKDILKEEGISVLFLESEGGLGSLTQLKTRIEAFSEMISN